MSRPGALLLAGVAWLLASCATFLGPRDVEIPLSKLQQAVASKFPFNNRFLELLDISVTNPRVSLQPDTNRVTTTMDASIAPPFLQRSYTGSFAISGNLKFDPARNALVLGEPRVENFTVNGLDPLYANKISLIGSLLVEQMFNETPLYTFKPEDLRYGGSNFTLSKITTKSNGLVVTLEPVQ